MITAVILTYNEELHIARCVKSLHKITKQIIVVDSFSTDNTESICRGLNVKFYQRKWLNYSDQLNWALNNLTIDSDWVLRIDADEYLSKELIENLKKLEYNLTPNLTSISVNRLMHFKGTPLKMGDMYPIQHVRIWKYGYGHCENRWMDERIIVREGETKWIKGDIIDDNLNSISWWISKHNKYAIREAIDYFQGNHKKIEVGKPNGKERRKLKSYYYNSPIFLRAILYFVYRYIMRLGFLEGQHGFVWHFLQSFWYRMLVDINILEAIMEKNIKGTQPEVYLRRELEKL